MLLCWMAAITEHPVPHGDLRIMDMANEDVSMSYSRSHIEEAEIEEVFRCIIHI
ncbi:hypothetical protein KIN20_008994 [Parelaphostrongylus tenuis]|uniref:Uncharacterized protein n=1 Tax=Parelaphostrongylus tenuis TaxID=148309 RepID=A0AAD5QKZ4_PARTN|nr:hypothetical protein KIN20_008994 [Parelaphostrongylus tenuis]